MAILEGPLFSDSAKGKIRKTVSFFKRGEWFHLMGILSFKDRESAGRLEEKMKFQDGVSAWRALSGYEREPYEEVADWRVNAFNVFMGRYLLGLPPLEAANPSDTVTDETSYGIAKNAGVSADYSRGDHTHGTPVLGSPGEGHIVILPFSYSAVVQGAWTLLLAATRWSNACYYMSGSAINDRVNFQVYLAAGTYTLVYLCDTFNTGGIASFLIDADVVGSADQYSAVTTFNVRKTVTGISVSTGGLKTLGVKAASKNASSSGYQLEFECIVLFRTA